MTKILESPRERAARALCRFAAKPEDVPFEGRAMWMSYLAEADAVLEATLFPAEWEKVKAQGPADA